MNTLTSSAQEQADDAYDAAQEEAAAAITFDSILEELTSLSPAEKAAELRKAQRGERSALASDAWDRLMHRATHEQLAEMVRVSRAAPLRSVRLYDEV